MSLFGTDLSQAAPQEYGNVVELGPGNEKAAKEMLSAMLKYGSVHYSEEEPTSVWKDFSLDLSGRDLRGSRIHSEYDSFHNVKFDNSDLSFSDFNETGFANCSFRGTKLRGVDIFSVAESGCDLTDADISGSRVALTIEQMKSTLNFKRKDLSHVSFSGSLDSLDFSGFDLRYASFPTLEIPNCNFTDADISRSSNSLTAKQLRSTYNYQKKDLSNTTLYGDLRGLSFAGFDLGGTNFFGPINDCDFTDADIAGALFSSSRVRKSISTGEGITAHQLYSTRSYREKNLGTVEFHSCELQGFDFSGQALSIFVGCDLANANFEGAFFIDARRSSPVRIIPKRLFSSGVSYAKNFTYEQFASTRTYKSGSLPRGIELPDDIRKRFEAEQNQKKDKQ